MRSFIPSIDKNELVIAQNIPAVLDLENFLRRGIAKGTDLEAVARESRQAQLSAMLAAYEVDPSSGHLAPWNLPRHDHQKSDHIYPNTEILAGSQLETVKRNLLRKLVVLQNLLSGKKPIILTDYHDDSDKRGCFTTDMLREIIGEILGPDGYRAFVSDDLRANFIGEGPLKGDPAKYVKRFKIATDTGGIVIGGGSFKDADDVHGQFFQEQIMPLILDNHMLRGLMICWSYQVMARTFAKRYNLDLHVLRGSLHWGALPVKVLKDSGLGRMYPKGTRGGRIGHHTAMFTNGDHLVPGKPVYLGSKIVGSDPSTGERRFLKVVAMDPLTGMPLGFQTDDGRIIGFAGHPEVQRGDDVIRIQTFARQRIADLLSERYGVNADQVAGNFDTKPGHHGRDLVEKDIGPAFYAGILDSFADSLIKALVK